jgi:Skp family chaperone for outer membrane proteins
MTGAPRRLALALVCALAVAPAAPAQQPPEGAPFLLLNQERILTGSRTGQALLAAEEEARDALRTEAREIDRSFEEEERRLTELRATTPPEDFRILADEFDARVVEARRLQDQRSQALALEWEQRRRRFYAEVGPILVGLLSRYGAHAIFDESSVLLADQSLNITDSVIAEIDARAERGEIGSEGFGVGTEAPDAE